MLGTGAADDTAAAAKDPTVTIKGKLRPGEKVGVELTGYGRRERVRLQFGIYSDPPQNCCASKPYPPVKKPGIRVNRKGKLGMKVRMPRRYAQCTGVNCPSRNWQRYRRGDRVYLGAAGQRSGRYAQDVGRIGTKRGPKLMVEPDTITSGESIVVEGRGWPRRKRVQLLIGEPASEPFPAGKVRANRKGRFSRRLGPIEADPGRWIVLGCRPAGSCRKRAKASFEIEPAP